MPEFNYTIKKLWKKEVDTKFGKKIKYLIKFQEPSVKDRLYTAWQGKWNENWKEGDKITFVPAQLKYIKYKDKQGEDQVLYQIKAPLEKRFNFVLRNDFEGLRAKVSALEERIKKLENDNEDIEL